MEGDQEVDIANRLLLEADTVEDNGEQLTDEASDSFEVFIDKEFGEDDGATLRMHTV